MLIFHDQCHVYLGWQGGGGWGDVSAGMYVFVGMFV